MLLIAVYFGMDIAILFLMLRNEGPSGDEQNSKKPSMIMR